MTDIDVTLQEHHLARLRELVLPSDGTEGAAYVLFSKSKIAEDPWDRCERHRFLSYEVLAIPPGDIISAGQDHITWSTSSFVRLLKQAQDDGLTVGICHSHPDGPATFSEQDHLNEAELAALARNRNGVDSNLLSLLITGQGSLRAQLWQSGPKAIPASVVRVVGRHLAFHSAERARAGDEAFARQALAFGETANAQLRGLKVGVVGCGGTGSATAMLLARLGVGHVVLFDEDIVETTNLNRLHGTSRSDADGMRRKVDVVAKSIADMSLGCRVHSLPYWAGHVNCRDALKSCDVIFGCTDDNDGRLLLNRLAYFYLIPVIDMGLAIEPNPNGVGVRELSGRVTVLAPGGRCLLCRRIVDIGMAREEDLKRRNPREFERRKREAYVRGGDNPAPAVVTFTTATACMAIDELLQGMTSFRSSEGWTWQRVRRFDLMVDRTPGSLQSDDCPVCIDRTYWGLGDVEPFLDRVG